MFWRYNAPMVLAGALALVATPCAAKGRTTNQFRVTTTVVSGCTVSATPMVFFVPVPANIDVSSTSTLTLRCSPNVAYSIDIDAGLNPQGATGRRVANAAKTQFLTYDIFKDPPHSQVWGRGNLKNVAGNSGATGLAVYTVYGLLNAKSTMTAGGYRDTLTITVTF